MPRVDFASIVKTTVASDTSIRFLPEIPGRSYWASYDGTRWSMPSRNKEDINRGLTNLISCFASVADAHNRRAHCLD